MKNQLAVYEPRSLTEALEVSNLLVTTGFLPGTIRKPAQALAVIMAGKELGLSAMQSLRALHIIDGKVTMSSDLMVGLAKSHPDCEYFIMARSTDAIAEYRTKRRSDPEPTSLVYTIEQAQKAGVMGKDNWRKYPAAMLRARCASALARIVYSDILTGVYSEDELGAPTHHEDYTEFTFQPTQTQAEEKVDEIVDVEVVEGESL